MCLLSPSSKKKLKATFTTPRSATGFVVRSASPPPQRRESEMLYQQSSQANYTDQANHTNQAQQQYISTQYRTRRPSAWTDPERGVREWKADIDRLERDARAAEQRTGSASGTLIGQGRGTRRGTGRSAEGSTLGGNAESVALS